MRPRRGRSAARAAHVNDRLRTGVAALLAAAAVTALLPGIVAAAGACTFAINGVPLDAAATQDQAIVVGIDDDASLTASGPGPLGNVVVQAEFWPLTVPAQSGFTDESEAQGTVSPSDRGAVQGLYHVVVTSDNPACLPSIGWVRIAAASPFDGLPGKVGGALALVGVAVLLLALRSALAGRGGRRIGFIGGALVGLGALVVAQQAGAAAIDARSAVIWTALPATVGAAVMHGVGIVRPTSTGYGGRDVDIRVGAGGGVTISNPSSGAGVGSGTFHPVPTAQPGTSVGPTTVPEVSVAGPVPGAAAGGVAATTRAKPPLDTAAEGSGSVRSFPMDEPTPTVAPAGEAAAADDAAGGAGGGAGVPLGVGGAEDAAPAGEAGGSPAPPRESYARLDAPDAVVAEIPFELVVGLSKEPDPDVAAAPLIVPESVHGDYDLTIQLLADGFDRVDGGDDPWLVRLPVTGGHPYPSVNLTLRPVPTDRPVRARQVKALYVVGGQAMGEATRPIIVVDTEERLAALGPIEAPPLATLSAPRGDDAPDLTIRIEHRDSEASGTWWWQMLVPERLGIHVSSDPLPVDLGADAPAFLVSVITGVHKAQGTPQLKYVLKGYGNQIAQQVPTAFWDVLAQVIAKVAPETPTVQILSAEAHVPWELAVLPSTIPLANAGTPPYLGAQVDIGRWVLGNPPPRVPPPGSLRIATIAAISGVYAGAANLEDAQAEAEALETTYHAEAVYANAEPVLACLGRKPAYDVIHFAVHGDYGATAQGDGAVAASPRILLADGTDLDEATVRGFEPFAGSPFVFLNACQIGAGNQVLGDYAGVAAAFLYSGAAGVVAPLWSVDDTDARGVCLRFYHRVLGGMTPAAALRLERASFFAAPETSSSTFLAYQFYGHPTLKVEDALPGQPVKETA